MYYLLLLTILLSCHQTETKKKSQLKSSSPMLGIADWDQDNISNEDEINQGLDPYVYNGPLSPRKIYFKNSDKIKIAYSLSPLDIYKNLAQNDFKPESLKIFYTVDNFSLLSVPVKTARLISFSDNFIIAPQSTLNPILPSFSPISIDPDIIGINQEHFLSMKNFFFSDKETYILLISTPETFLMHKISRLLTPREFLKKNYPTIYRDFDKNFNSWKHNFNQQSEDIFFSVAKIGAIKQPIKITMPFTGNFTNIYSLKPGEKLILELQVSANPHLFTKMFLKFVLFNNLPITDFAVKNPHSLVIYAEKNAHFMLQNKSDHLMNIEINLKKPKLNKTKYYYSASCGTAASLCYHDSFKNLNITTITD